MQHKCKVTVIDKNRFNDSQDQYLADPKSDSCPFYHVGDEFLFERYGGEDSFWREGKETQCDKAWDCISRYIDTALQGGSLVRNWTNDERMMLACCNNRTRLVIFKIERIDYKVIKIDGMDCEECAQKASMALEKVPGVQSVEVKLEKKWAEVFVDKDSEISDDALKAAVEQIGYRVGGID